VQNYGTARQATGDNIIRRLHVSWWINKAADTLITCGNYCFSTAKMVKRVPLNLTFLRKFPFSPVLGLPLYFLKLVRRILLKQIIGNRMNMCVSRYFLQNSVHLRSCVIAVMQHEIP
jgi:hypothetical protein